MKQDDFYVVPSYTFQVCHSRLLPRVSRCIGVFLVAALLLVMVNAFASVPSAHASGGWCWSYNTWSSEATSQESQDPILYGNNDGGPKLGVGLDGCDNLMMLQWSRTICYEGCPDLYYQVDWKRPGFDTWQHFTVVDNDLSSSFNYVFYIFKNTHAKTYYNFAVKVCRTSDGCRKWSPTVGINT